MTLQPTRFKLRPGKAKLALPSKQAKPFYLSKEWRSLIMMIKRKRGNKCHDPDHPPGVPRGGGGRIIGDHIHEIADGGAMLDPSNIMLRCHLCHQRKTVRARITRFHG